MKLTNSYCDGIYKSLIHHQYKCPACGLWTIWRHIKTGDHHSDCKCTIATERKSQ